MTGLADILAEHRLTGAMYCACVCGFSSSTGQDRGFYEQYVLHVVEAVAAAGLAVIQLPEPEDDGDGQLWFGELRVDTTGRGDRTIHRTFTDLSPAQARDRAADLLAAAAAAEQVTA